MNKPIKKIQKKPTKAVVKKPVAKPTVQKVVQPKMYISADKQFRADASEEFIIARFTKRQLEDALANLNGAGADEIGLRLVPQ